MGAVPITRGVVALALAAAVVTLGAAGPNDHWPQFRGSGSGVALDDPALPDTWSSTQNIAWKIDIPGRGWSSPVVWGDHVFVTAVANDKGAEQPLKPAASYVARSNGGPMSGAAIDSPSDPHRWVVYDVDFGTGKIRWQRTVSTGVPGQPKHEKNSYASETPVTDGERVYAYFGGTGLFAFDLAGKPVWSKPMDPFKVRSRWAAAASPVLFKDRIYIVNDNDEQSFIAAYDARSGAEVWRANRKEGSNWSTPFVWAYGSRTEIVTAGTDKVRSYDLNGRLLWELSGMSSIAIPTPFAAHDLLYITSGYPGDQLRPVYAIRPGATADISLRAGETSNQSIAWSHPTLGPYNPSPLVYGDYYYTLIDRGLVLCHDAKTGKEVYGRQRITMDPVSFTASPWAYNGKLFAISEEGDTYVMQAGPDFRMLGKNSLNEMTLATPAVAHGSVIVRTASKLYRIAKTAAR